MKKIISILFISISYISGFAQLDSNGNLKIPYQKKIYSLSVEPYKFELTPFTVNGDTEFRNYYGTGDFKFFVSNGSHGNGNTIGLLIKENGNVGIGTTSPDMKLTVKGNIHAEEVKIDLNVPAPDYVFKEDYDLRSIEELENFIKENSHLPEIPSAKEFERNGIMQAEMDMNLLKKIEELTLYTIQQQKEIESLKKENQEVKLLNTKLIELQSRLEKLETEK